ARPPRPPYLPGGHSAARRGSGDRAVGERPAVGQGCALWPARAGHDGEGAPVKAELRQRRRGLRGRVSAMVRTLAASLLPAAALWPAVGPAAAPAAGRGPATSPQPRRATSAQPSAPLPAAIPSGETLRAAGPVAPLPLVLLMGAVVVAGCASRRRLAV